MSRPAWRGGAGWQSDVLPCESEVESAVRVNPRPREWREAFLHLTSHGAYLTLSSPPPGSASTSAPWRRRHPRRRRRGLRPCARRPSSRRPPRRSSRRRTPAPAAGGVDGCVSVAVCSRSTGGLVQASLLVLHLHLHAYLTPASAPPVSRCPRPAHQGCAPRASAPGYVHAYAYIYA